MNVPQCGPNDWTFWINIDDPFDGCDVEMLPLIRRDIPDLVCEEPVGIDARSIESGIRVNPSQPNIDFSLKGLRCCSENGRVCSDYEVRFCCPQGITILQIVCK